MKWLRRAGYVLLVLLAVGAAGYWWLLAESRKAAPGDHAIDLDAVRRLAASPGEMPREIRVETVARFAAPRTFVVAGDGFDSLDLPVSSYELVYPGRIALIDTALDARVGKSMSITAFDPAAYGRMSGAIARARLILVTHEHPDHVGGLLAQRDPRRPLAAARLTAEQVRELQANLSTQPFDLLRLPASLFAGYRPLAYGRYQAVAPGIVLIKAPGHTPGSQMIYVRRADGAEFLFVGDVAWQMRNIEAQREKARLVTWMAEEDRAPVRRELAALARLHADHPEVHMIPGHDAAAIDALVKAGLIARGF